MSGSIEVRNVSKQFRLQADRPTSIKEFATRRGRDKSATHFWALDDVSIDIPEGSMYALVGHNGSGKSTLLRCIAGIYRPDTGHVKASGRISTLLDPRPVRAATWTLSGTLLAGAITLGMVAEYVVAGVVKAFASAEVNAINRREPITGISEFAELAEPSRPPAPARPTAGFTTHGTSRPTPGASTMSPRTACPTPRCCTAASPRSRTRATTPAPSSATPARSSPSSPGTASPAGSAAAGTSAAATTTN